MTSFNEMTVVTLKTLAKSKGLKGYSKMTKSELILLLENASSEVSIVDVPAEQNLNREEMKPAVVIVDDTGFVDASGAPVLIASHLASGTVGQSTLEKITEELDVLKPESEVEELVDLVIPKKSHTRHNRAMRRMLAARFRKGLIKKPEFMV